MAKAIITTTVDGVNNDVHTAIVAAFPDLAAAGQVITRIHVETTIDGIPDDPSTWADAGILAAHETASNASQELTGAAYPDLAAADPVSTETFTPFPRWGGRANAAN